jgi:hypothetical protein
MSKIGRLTYAFAGSAHLAFTLLDEVVDVLFGDELS